MAGFHLSVHAAAVATIPGRSLNALVAPAVERVKSIDELIDHLAVAHTHALSPGRAA